MMLGCLGWLGGWWLFFMLMKKLVNLKFFFNGEGYWYIKDSVKLCLFKNNNLYFEFGCFLFVIMNRES